MINVVIQTDGDPLAIEPDFIEEVLSDHGLDVWSVKIEHVEQVF